ncbi:MAG: histidinol dehydrogenase [Vicinamibacterales bacterium]|nr:histidinol dehydrogenase [Vicinamibacterales bacterium]
MIRIVQAANRREVASLLSPAVIRDAATDRAARRIVDRVRKDGEAALKMYARKLDGLTGGIEVTRAQMEAGAAATPAAVRAAIRRTASHIRKVAARQVPGRWRLQVAPGVQVEQRVIPLDRVGCYVPGGRYPLPSSLLMTAIPARVAGVREVVAVCPRPEPSVMTAALEAGVDRLFRVGGAHAVAALAYGTKTVPRVDKIVGPGNRWVSAAKALVAADCAIDFYAGPSEILIVSGTAPAAWIAADLIAQAEHDPDARAVFVTWRAALARQVAEQVARQLPDEGPAASALFTHGGIIVTRTRAEAVALANEAASEHLVVDDDRMAGEVRAAGAVFVGPWTAQVAGDYAIGSNHVLPTAGAARFRGGLHAADFVRLVSVQRLTRQGLGRLGATITTLARAEGLTAHAASVDIRLAPAAPRPRKRKVSRT